jgi:hypothetical protein
MAGGLGAGRSRRRSVKDFVEILVVNPATQILGCCHLHIDIRACGPILYEGNAAHILGVERPSQSLNDDFFLIWKISLFWLDGMAPRFPAGWRSWSVGANRREKSRN